MAARYQCTPTASGNDFFFGSFSNSKERVKTMGTINDALDYLADTNDIEIIESPAITASTGYVASSRLIRFGKIVFLEVNVGNNASIASGGNVFAGTLDDASLRPYLNAARSNDYTGAHACLFNCSAKTQAGSSDGGYIVCRNASTTAVGANSTLRGCFVYFIA